MLYVFTTCALNSVPRAKLLAASAKTHMPDARFVLVLTDEKPTGFRLEDEGFDEVLYLDDFADVLGNPRGWAFGHTIGELATAIKPFTASKLMERADCEAVMFFDPECVLFGPMTEMRQALRDHSVVLTPHASLLHENSDWISFERDPLTVGCFNLGFFGFRNDETGRTVSSWWRFRLRGHCRIDPEHGLFIDQKWMDLLPGYIDDIKVMREPVYNIARWNTFQRKLTKEGGQYLADGAPVQFVHFSGFEKTGPDVQGLYDRRSEPLITNIEVLRELSLWYSGRLDTVRTRPEYSAPWGLAHYSNGQPVEDPDRRRYGESEALQNRFPDPFAADRLDSYWLYHRKHARIEAETQFADREPMFNLISGSVQAHNAMLRKQNQALEAQLFQTTAELNNTLAPDTEPHRHDPALEAQLAQTTAELKAVRKQETRQRDVVARLQAGMRAALTTTADSRILQIFGPVAESGAFDGAAYLRANPDVAQSGADPLVHFIRRGLAEQRGAEGLSANTFFEDHIDLFIRVLLPA